MQAKPWKSDRLSSMPAPHPKFPLAEGIGIFVGIIAWDLLTDGHMEIIKAGLIAVPCSLVWFGIRLWNAKAQDKHR